MNKLTKVGLSALCGSLAAISSANAGEMTVTGGVDMSWASYDDASTGNPIGIGSNLTFKGSGELDNGWTFGVTVAMLNQDAYSTTVVNIGMGGLGLLNINQGDSGNGIKAIDDKMPTAWEEAWGAGLGTGIQLVSGVGTNNNIQYTTPTVGGITVALATAPDMGSADVNDKGSAVSADNTGAGYDARININPSLGTEILSGLNLFAGGHVGERYVDSTAGNDTYQAIGGFTYSLGPVAIGYARSGIDTGANTTVTDPAWYKNSMFGISFNVNDDLSVSYAEHVSEQGHVNSGALSSFDLEVTSFQVAYTMGGASVRFADISVDNASYQDAKAFDKSAQMISVSLAF
jgi:hypothetical protein